MFKWNKRAEFFLVAYWSYSSAYSAYKRHRHHTIESRFTNLKDWFQIVPIFSLLTFKIPPVLVMPLTLKEANYDHIQHLKRDSPALN